MSLTLVTAPTTEPLSLTEAKAQLRLDSDADDRLIQLLITAAREWVEGQTKRALVSQVWDQTMDGNWPWKHGGPRIELEKNPVISIGSITYATGASPNPTLAASQYTSVTRNHGSYIVPAYGITWPTVRSVPEAVTVRFTAGYTTVPKPLVHAIAMLVTHWYENREVIETQARQINMVPYSVEALISPYRRA